MTGTNGKTTTAFLLREILEAAGVRCGLLGTVKQVVGGVEEEVVRTTPEAIDLQATFRRMLDGGDRACAMEVSSHALALHRCDAIRFDVAVFTNLTQDHLDFHADMEDYFRAKRRLFEIGAGDRGRQRRRSLRAPPRRRTSTASPSPPRGRRPTSAPREVEFDASGAGFTVHLATGRKFNRSLESARRRRCGCGRGCRGTSTSPTRSRRFAAATALGVEPEAAATGARRGGARRPGASSRSTRGRRSRCWSTTPTPRTRSRTCCGRRGG